MIGVCLFFIEGENDQSVVHEIDIAEKWLKEASCPSSSECDYSIVIILGRNKNGVYAPVVSCPSFVMFGVMNDHCGSVLAARSEANEPKPLISERRVALLVTDS